jgi:hypothetical protein
MLNNLKKFEAFCKATEIVIDYSLASFSVDFDADNDLVDIKIENVRFKNNVAEIAVVDYAAAHGLRDFEITSGHAAYFESKTVAFSYSA